MWHMAYELILHPYGYIIENTDSITGINCSPAFITTALLTCLAFWGACRLNSLICSPLPPHWEMTRILLEIKDITHGVQNFSDSPTITVRYSMLEKHAAVVVTSCLLAGLLTVSSRVIARRLNVSPAPTPNRVPARIGDIGSITPRASAAGTSREWENPREPVGHRNAWPPPARRAAAARSLQHQSEASTEKSSIKSWFSSTFSAFAGIREIRN